MRSGIAVRYVYALHSIPIDLVLTGFRKQTFALLVSTTNILIICIAAWQIRTRIVKSTLAFFARKTAAAAVNFHDEKCEEKHVSPYSSPSTSPARYYEEEKGNVHFQEISLLPNPGCTCWHHKLLNGNSLRGVDCRGREGLAGDGRSFSSARIIPTMLKIGLTLIMIVSAGASAWYIGVYPFRITLVEVGRRDKNVLIPCKFHSPQYRGYPLCLYRRVPLFS